MSSHLILVVEEHLATRSFLAQQLAADGYEVLLAENRRHALHLLGEHQPQLVLADINGETLGLLNAVRGGDGIAAAIDPNTPMIVLTARADELDRVRVFDRGGDDVVTKPFSYTELPRTDPRAAAPSPAPLPSPRQPGRLADCQPRRPEVRLGDRQVELAPKGFELLLTLIADPTRVFTRGELLRNVWGYCTPSRTVDSHACRLRQKISTGREKFVINVWGVGYRLCDPVTSQHATTTGETR